MKKIFYIIIIIFYSNFSHSKNQNNIREVSSTSCNTVRINLGLGMTTQIVFQQEPKATLYADKRHFKINTNTLAPRSLAIIPYVDSSELQVFKDSNGNYPSPKKLAISLDKSFRTNLFVFFENNNQLMFELRFVEKEKADFLIKVKQIFKKDCVL
jgi:hypothetical protein